MVNDRFYPRSFYIYYDEPILSIISGRFNSKMLNKLLMGEKDAIRHSIAPWLSVRNSLKALAFYKTAFGAEEAYRMNFPGGVVAKLTVHGAEFWLGDESPEHSNFSPETLGGCSVRIILTVPDPDQVFARVVAAGASEVYPVGEEHGWRIGRVVDPFGHHWEIGKPL